MLALLDIDYEICAGGNIRHLGRPVEGYGVVISSSHINTGRAGGSVNGDRNHASEISDGLRHIISCIFYKGLTLVGDRLAVLQNSEVHRATGESYLR